MPKPNSGLRNIYNAKMIYFRYNYLAEINRDDRHGRGTDAWEIKRKMTLCLTFTRLLFASTGCFFLYFVEAPYRGKKNKMGKI